LEIQAKVRQLGQSPNNAGRQSIETAREQLTILLNELKKAMDIAGVVEINPSTTSINDPLDIWDDILNEPVPGGPNSMPDPTSPADFRHASTGQPQIEDRPLSLPSNGIITYDLAPLEITHRVSHAELHLHQIRTLIAEKSFQYSHVIRVAPRKGVNTRSRAEVKKLNLQISVHCRSYTQCRSRLVKLRADPALFNHLQELTSDDVKASTAVVNPNEPGSTRLKLSWIWQSSGGQRWGLSTGLSLAGNNNAGLRADADAAFNIIECMYIYIYIFSILFSHTCPIVRRVHWLRARAQLMRWREQVTLTTYEMQWTVAYFRHMSKKWVFMSGTAKNADPADPCQNATYAGATISGSGQNAGSAGAGAGAGSPEISGHTSFGMNKSASTGQCSQSAGEISYARRKHDIWVDITKKADSFFRSANLAYQSPL
jgi:hypothetical protein